MRGLMALLAVAGLLSGCDPNAVPAGYVPGMVGYHTCDVFDEFGARLPLRQCGGPDHPTLGQYHERPPPRYANGPPVYPAPYTPLPEPGVGHH
jgi:hypothetical protein